jgi:hypothetical protein
VLLTSVLTPTSTDVPPEHIASLYDRQLAGQPEAAAQVRPPTPYHPPRPPGLILPESFCTQTFAAMVLDSAEEQEKKRWSILCYEGVHKKSLFVPATPLGRLTDLLRYRNPTACIPYTAAALYIVLLHHGKHCLSLVDTSSRVALWLFLTSSHTHQFNPHFLCHRGSILSLIYAQQQVSWVIEVQSSMVAVGDCICNGRSEPQRPPTPVATPKDFAFTDSDHDCRACKF